VPWYGLHLLSLQVVAAIALLYAGLRVAPGGHTMLLFLAYFCVAGLDFLTRVQFTGAAFVASQAGLWLALSLRRPPARGRAPWLALAAAALFLMVAGSLVRFEAFALAAALTVPAGIVVMRGVDHKTTAAVGGVVIAAVVAALALRAYDRAYYERDAGWRDFRAFNDALRPVLDYGQANEYAPRTAAAFRSVGWSRNDHRLLLQWFHPDDGVFTAAKLRALVARNPLPTRDRLARLPRELQAIAADAWTLCLLLVLPLLVVVRAGEPRARRALVAAAATAALVLLWLVLFRKTPPQVFLPILSFPGAVAVCLAGRPLPARTGTLLAAVLALAGVAGSVTSARSVSARAAAYRQTSLRSLFALESPPRLIVSWATDFPLDAIAPLDPPSTIGGLRLFSTGWPQRTPVAKRMLSSFGAGDVLEALAWRPQVALVAPRWVLPHLAQYARRHRGWELRFVAEPTTSGLGLFRVAEATRLEPQAVEPEASEDGR
jgi:hypothetical protein